MPNQSTTLGMAAANLEKFREKLDNICDQLEDDFGRDGKSYVRNIYGGINLYGIDDLPSTLTRADSTMIRLKAELDRANRRNMQLEADNQDLRNSTTSSTELRDLQRKNEQLEDENRSLRQRLRYSGSTVGSSATGSTTSQADKIDQLKDEKRDLQIENAHLQRDKRDYKAQRDALSGQVSKLKDEKTALEKDKNDLQAKIDDLKPKEGANSPCSRCRARVNHLCPLANGWKKFK